MGVELDPAHLSGWRLGVARYGPPVAVTLLAVVEVAWLRRVHRVGFRGPIDPD